jgi:S1-C subfamily serine protease
MRRDPILGNLLLTALLASFAAAPAFAQTAAKEMDQAELEAKLEAARAKLEAAAREVAELSGELTGPVMHDFVVAYHGGRRAMLGINIGGADGDAKDGVHVQSVTPGGPASDAGLKAGDVIVSIDGKSLRGTDKQPNVALLQHMRTLEPGDKVKVEYRRDGKMQTAEITTESMSAGRVLALPAIEPLMGVHPAPGLEHPPFAMAFGRARMDFLDMELVTLTPKLGRYFGTDKGVLVVRPPRKGDFKLEEGDVIVDIDGRKPENGGHALRILRSYQPGEKVTFNVLRDRKPLKLTVELPAKASYEPEEGAFFFDEPVPSTVPVPRPADEPT